MRPDTHCLHTGIEVDARTGASSVPIYQASTFHQADFDHPPQYDYARSGNPTRAAVETAIASLEGASHGFAFASGMAAITSVLLTLPAGSHIVACDDLYGGTFRALTRVFSRLNIATTFVDATKTEHIAAAIRPQTRALYLETPSNPLLQIIDLRAAAALAREHGLITIVDNTFMSPYLQKPHELGIDIVIHSATKFLGGHSDLVAGVATVNSEKLAEEIYLIQNGFGSILGPHDSWLLLRGLKTLAVRMRQGQSAAAEIAQYLANHEKVKQVFYPGLPSHPGHAIHKEQAKGPGAILSFDIGNEDAVRQFVSYLQLPIFAVSLGAVESILSYPARMSHASMPAAERAQRGIGDGLLRLSVGLEDSADLLEDVQQALSRI